MTWRIPSLCILGFCLLSCSFFGDDDNPYGPTLANLKDVDLPENIMPVEKVPLDQIEDSYRSALEVANDADIRHRILIRLADIEMARSEQRQLDATEQKEYFGEAIAMYQELIRLNREREAREGTPTNERLLYQLSKAYALDGKVQESNDILERLVTKFPESAFAAEADFRRAERAFSQQNYALSENLYGQVMAVGEETPFYHNAVYMHGWSQFKRSRYRASIRSFTEVLDASIGEDPKMEQLSNSQKNLVEDTLRVLGIAFSYLEGAESITEIYSKLGARNYQHLLYQELGDLYLEKKRYRDSADTYLHYVKNFSQSDYAPGFGVRAIEVYQQGNFPSLILPAKEAYVRNYGIYSQYWSQRNEEVRETLRPHLHQFLQELSSYYHSEAQALDKAAKKYDQQVATGEKPGKKPESSTPNFLKAASLYEEFIATFPEDPKTPGITFLMAEAYFEADNLAEAVDAYETVAYQYLDPKKGAEAGYSAILALRTLVDTAIDDNKTQWLERKTTSAQNFADYYPGDKRAAAVLTQAAQEMFAQNQFEKSLKAAKRVTQWQPPAKAALQQTAWLIVSHSQFDLGLFGEAEYSYRQVLARLGAKDKEREKIIERIAASIYKTAEQLIANDNKAAAIERLLQVREVSPNSTIAMTAQYDAANYLMELTQWQQAEQVIMDFRRHYPKHKLVATLPAKLAVIYQELKQWNNAAQTLTGMSKNNRDPEVRRQSLYLAAELFEKSNNWPLAIDRYRTYAHTYEQPFDLAIEARFHLVELYEKTKESSKRRFWLKKLIAADAQAGRHRSDRSRELAAMAASEFANDDYQAFKRIPLKLPLKKSLRKKKKALDKTIVAYRKVLDYGIAEYTTQANHRIGMIYAQLSKDMMNSERPKNLDALALEQYDILLEEQAFPFEEKAIDIHAANSERSWNGVYDEWVKRSFNILAELLPARYGKKETRLVVSDGIH